MKSILSSTCSLLLHGGVALAMLGCGASAEPTRRQDPPSQLHEETLDELADSHPEYLLVVEMDGRGPGFTSQFSQELLDTLKPNVKDCSRALMAAQRSAARRDALYADRSFRNCAIRDGRVWLQRQLVGFRQSVDARRHDLALEYLGAALASLQAFYSYSNYIELLEERMDWRSAQKASHQVWGSGPFLVEEARLQSDFSPAIRRNECPAAPPTLDKRTPRSPAGRQRLARWPLLAHEAAYQLALQDSLALIVQAWKDRPSMSAACGSTVLIGFTEGE